MNTLHIISHTHWDREWYQTFQQFRLKLVHLVDGLLETLEKDPGFKHFPRAPRSGDDQHQPHRHERPLPLRLGRRPSREARLAGRLARVQRVERLAGGQRPGRRRLHARGPRQLQRARAAPRRGDDAARADGFHRLRSGSYTLARYPLDEWAEGRASGIRGTLASGSGAAESHRGHLRVGGSLEGATTDWLGIHTARWRMSQMHGELLPVPHLQAEVRLEDFFFLGRTPPSGEPLHDTPPA